MNCLYAPHGIHVKVEPVLLGWFSNRRRGLRTRHETLHQTLRLQIKLVLSLFAVIKFAEGFLYYFIFSSKCSTKVSLKLFSIYNCAICHGLLVSKFINGQTYFLFVSAICISPEENRKHEIACIKVSFSQSGHEAKCSQFRSRGFRSIFYGLCEKALSVGSARTVAY